MLFLAIFRRSCIGSRACFYLFHCSKRLHFIPTPKVIGQLGVTLICVTALKQVETSPKVEGEGPLKTQPNGNRTAIRVFFGRIQNTPMGGLSGTRLDTVSSSKLYLLRATGSK